MDTPINEPYDYPDLCPRCLKTNGTRLHTALVPPDGVCCSYRCPACRYEWTCNWGAQNGEHDVPEPTMRRFGDLLGDVVDDLAARHAVHRGEQWPPNSTADTPTSDSTDEPHPSDLGG